MEQQTQATLDPSQYPKLTDWANEPDLKTLKGDYVAAKPSHDEQANKIKKWTDLLHVTGTAKPPTVKGRSAIQPKLVRRQAEWRYSALTEPFLGSSKLYKVSPVTYEDVAAARQNELLLNWQFRTKLNRVKFIDDYVRAVVDEGTAVLKTGWVRNTTTVMVQVPVYDMFPVQTEEEVAQFQQALQMREAAPQEYEQLDPAIHEAVSHYDETGEVTVAVQNGVTEVEEERVIENRPTVEILNPLNVYIDPTCGGDLDNALFVIYSFETNKAELQKQKDRYKNLDRVNWENASVVSDGEHTARANNEFAFTDATRKKVVAYEYWGFFDINKDDTLKPFVATWIGDTMSTLQWVKKEFEKVTHAPNAYRKLNAVLSMARTYGKSELEFALQYAITHNITATSSIKSILDKKLYLQKPANNNVASIHIFNNHEYLRGNIYQ